MITGDLKSKIDKVWEAFWTGGLSNPITVIEQMTYFLFLRRLDEIHTAMEQQAAFLKKKEIENPVYLKEQYELRWSYFKYVDPEVMFKLFTKENGVFEFLKTRGGNGTALGRYMKGATFMIPTPRLLSQVVDMLSEIDMVDRDTKGDVYGARGTEHIYQCASAQSESDSLRGYDCGVPHHQRHHRSENTVRSTL